MVKGHYRQSQARKAKTPRKRQPKCNNRKPENQQGTNPRKKKQVDRVG